MRFVVENPALRYMWRLCSLLVLLAGAPLGAQEGDISSSQAGGFDPTLSLARLARLEQQKGNGGAQEEAPVMTAGWDAKDGFHLRSADNNFLLRLGARIQVRHTYKARDQRGDEVGPNEVGDEDDFFFELERARIILSGHVLSPELTYQLIFDGDTDGGPVKTLDAYVHYKAGKHFSDNADLIQIGAGQRKPYFLRQEVTSSGKFQMVERSLANEFFNIDWNIGAWVQGDLGNVFYAFFVTNGFDSINGPVTSVDQVPAFTGKLDFSILGDEDNGRYEESNLKCDENPLLVVGVSGATDENNGSSGVGGEEFKVYQFGVDAVFKWYLFSLQAEYMGRWLDYEAGNTAAGGDKSALYAHGFYVQGGLFLRPSVLELVGRVSAVITDTGPQDGNGFEAGPGLNWYISHSHKVKLQTNLLYIDISGDLPNPSENLDDPTPSFTSTAANIEAGEQGFLLETQIQIEL